MRADDSSPLVLIPGSAATSKVWQADFLIGLAEDRQVITFDPRGFGSNDSTPVDELTIDSIASSLVDFMDALGLEQPDVLGWSWGGYIALWLGAFYGDSVGNLVLFSTTSGGDGLFIGAGQDQLSIYDEMGQDVPHAAIYPDNDDGNEGLCRFIAFLQIMPGPTMTSDQIRAQSAIVNAALSNNTLTEALPNITNPAIVGHGALDILLDIENARFLYNQLNNVSLSLGLDAGHAYLFQDVESTVEDVTDFLDYYDSNDDDDDDYGYTVTAASN